MNGIEYAYTEGEREYRTASIPVRFTGSATIVGEIRPVEGGWQYFPKGQKQGGEVFPTLRAVQADIEGVDE